MSINRNEIRIGLSNKENVSNKVTSLSENSTNTQYPSAKTVYDELMNVRTVTPQIIIDNSGTLNNVTKNWYKSGIKSSDLEYFEKIVYNITFEDNDFQMFYQYPNDDVDFFDVKRVYFDGTDCYWGIPNNEGLTKGSLICEGNTIQATLNKDRTITIGNTITNWDISHLIVMFGDVDFTYTIYSHKYLDTDFPYTFEDGNSSFQSWGGWEANSIIKDYGQVNLPTVKGNTIERIYTITFNDDDFSYLDYRDGTIHFDGTDCYWGEWDENDNFVLNKGTLICEGNVIQATYISRDDTIYFPDGNYISNMPYLHYFGDVDIKIRDKILLLEYVSNKTYYITDSFDDSICYPSVATLKNYAEHKSNKTTSWNSTTDNTRYPTEKLVKDSLDLKVNKQEDSLITVTNGSIILTEYHTKNRWTNEGAVGGSITTTKLISGSQGNAFYAYNFPSSVTSVTIHFLSNTTNAYITNGEGGNAISIDNSQNGTTYTATSDEGLGIRIDDGNKEVTYTVTSMTFNMNNWIDKIYPIGATYISTVGIEPSTLFGGVWERIKDRFLLSSGDTYVNATTGGSATVTLTSAQSGVPAHSHKYNDYNTTYTLKTTNRKPGTSTAVAYGTSLTSGGGATERTSSNNTTANASEAHENMPPYLVVYMWKRLA